MNFYKLISLIALVILIICLSSVGAALHYTNQKVIFPPNISKCPDNYVYDNDSKNCKNMNQMITGSECNNPNFDADKYQQPGSGPNSGLCAKKKWAQNCEVNWDGLTNNRSICYTINE